MFLTGFLSAVRQPFFFQPLIQPVMPLRSIRCRCSRSTEHGRFKASSAEIAAISSMRLLVVCGFAAHQFLFVVAETRIAPQPPGPGLPEQAPSVWIVTRCPLMY